MVKVPAPKLSGKGAPPPSTQAAANLERPEPTAFANLNFKVPNAFKTEFKIYAALRGESQLAILKEAFYLLRDKRSS
jgi:hypothetical protein